MRISFHSIVRPSSICSRPASEEPTPASSFSASAACMAPTMPTSGANTPIVAQGERSWTAELAVDATSLYWTDANGNLLKRTLDGGLSATLARSQPNDRYARIRERGGLLFFSNQVALFSMPVNSATPQVVFSGEQIFFDFTFDADSAYLASFDIQKVPLNGAPPSALITRYTDRVIAMTSDEKALYWLAFGGVSRAAK